MTILRWVGLFVPLTLRNPAPLADRPEHPVRAFATVLLTLRQIQIHPLAPEILVRQHRAAKRRPPSTRALPWPAPTRFPTASRLNRTSRAIADRPITVARRLWQKLKTGQKSGRRTQAAAVASISSNHFSSKMPVMITVSPGACEPSTSWRISRFAIA